MEDLYHYVYILECMGNTYYIGMTGNPDQRFKAHFAGKGSVFTKQFPPIRVGYLKLVGPRKDALKAEAWLKRKNNISLSRYCSGQRDFRVTYKKEKYLRKVFSVVFKEFDIPSPVELPIYYKV